MPYLVQKAKHTVQTLPEERPADGGLQRLQCVGAVLGVLRGGLPHGGQQPGQPLLRGKRGRGRLGAAEPLVRLQLLRQMLAG